jgi:cbb3-type cytochrome oxidase subunit 3
MTYDQIAASSQMISLAIFLTMLAGVLVYVMWPGNKERFEGVQARALDLDKAQERGTKP